METLTFFMAIMLFIILAEVTYIIMQTKRPSVHRAGRPMFIDTSVLIDGRIVAIAQSGFVSDTLMIPRSVIGELQFLADNADSEKRTRARHGLDVVAELQALDAVTVEIFPDGSRAEEGVDERLLKLAKQHNGLLCTIDYNLNKVAQVEDITVVNVNDLAKSLRMAYLPGEKITIALTTKGNDNSQAVGHLEDGTMVVVEQAKSKIGSIVEAEVIRSLQTAAGRMMFAKLIESTAPPARKKANGRANGRETTKQAQNPRSKKTTKDMVHEDRNEAVNPEVRKKVRSHRTPRASHHSPRKNNEDRLVELINKQ